MFPFSLLGEAKRWMKSEPNNCITSWNDFVRKFLTTLFLSDKIIKIQIEIVVFEQRDGETLYSAWERFKGLFQDCPHHNQNNKVLAYTLSRIFILRQR